MSEIVSVTGSVDNRRYRRDRRERVANDFYIEEPWVSAALLDVLRLDPWMSVRDPAAGVGNIVDSCRSRGLTAFGSDIVRRRPDFAVADYLDPAWPFGRVSWVISNPPFKLAERFIELALERSAIGVAMLLQLAFLEGQGKTERTRLRRRLHENGKLAHVLVSRSRISMPPGELYNPEEAASGGSIAYAWFIWRHGYQGPWTGGWFERPKVDAA